MAKPKKNKPNVNRKVSFSGVVRSLPGISDVLEKLDNVKRYSNHPSTVKQRKEDMKIIPHKSPNGNPMNDGLNNKSKRGRKKKVTRRNMPLV